MQPVRPSAAHATAKAVAGSWALFAAVAMLMFGHGLQETLLGIRAIREGFGPLTTGAVMACYYVGFILSSFRAPALIQRVGHVRCYAAFSAAASVAVLVHGLVVDPMVWGAMRAVTGFCLAGIYIVCESWLNGSSENSGRGGLIAVYTMILLLSISGGQMAVSVGDPSSIELFVAASAMLSLALLPMVLSVQPSPELDTPERFGFRELVDASPLGVVVAIGAGLIYGTYGGMGAAYGTQIGLSAAEVGIFMMVITISGGVAQWPAGFLSDIFPRRAVVLLCSAAAAVAAAIAATATPEEPVRLVLAAAAFGAASLPLYSLANAVTNDAVPRRKRVAASSKLILLYGSGSIAGPLMSAGAIELFGGAGFFLTLTAICVGLCACTLLASVARGARTIAESVDSNSANAVSAASPAPVLASPGSLAAAEAALGKRLREQGTM